LTALKKNAILGTIAIVYEIVECKKVVTALKFMPLFSYNL